MLKKIALSAVIAALGASAALAGGHGGMNKNMDKGMMKEDCAAMMQKMQGMQGEKAAMMREKAMQMMKEGNEKGCMEAMKKMMGDKMKMMDGKNGMAGDGMKKKM